MPEPAKQSQLASAATTLIGGVGGYALAQYCGVAIFPPGAAIILLLVLFTKSPVRPRWFRGVIAISSAHALWFFAASALADGWSATGLDIVMLSLGVIWLWWRPGLPAVLFLGFIQLASLGLNAYMLSAESFGSASHRALTAHCVLRTAALICLVLGYLRMRRERQAPPPLPTAETA